MKWVILEDAIAIAQRSCAEILEAAQQSILRRGIFKLVLAGGSTPALTYKLLAQTTTDFSHWLFFLGDERCLPANHPDRNSQLIMEQLIIPGNISLQSFFPIPAEKGPIAGAKEYSEIVLKNSPFDCVLLGLGEDGHTASLFPHHQHPSNALTVAVHHAPKPPSDRISLTAKSINSADITIFLVTGKEKQQAVEDLKNKQNIPAAAIQSQKETLILIDKSAAGI
jgi:6-phosphogluconolactonase